MFFLTPIYLILHLVTLTSATPLVNTDHHITHSLSARNRVSLVDKHIIKELKPYIHFARTGYCSFESLAPWKCGEPCDKVKGVSMLSMGGDGFAEPNWHIVYWKERNELISIHEGTAAEKFSSIAIDLQFPLRPINPKYFPRAPHDVKLHAGFQRAFETTVQGHLETLLNYLENGVYLSEEGKHYYPKSIVVTGYSMGGAVAQLMALYLRQHPLLHCPVRSISIGAPQIGNRAFAEWADKVFSPLYHNNIRIVNKKDPIPGLLNSMVGLLYEYLHSGVEYHVMEDGIAWIDCGTEDNYGQDPQCSNVNKWIDPRNAVDHMNLGKHSMLHVCDRDQKVNYWKQW
ncbi:hypothetical protein FRC03_002449 [Tulasnella sp. 419]|nr:hypothetical protein FRC03_002449 [Tulasnella sp. 419]